MKTISLAWPSFQRIIEVASSSLVCYENIYHITLTLYGTGNTERQKQLIRIYILYRPSGDRQQSLICSWIRNSCEKKEIL